MSGTCCFCSVSLSASMNQLQPGERLPWEYEMRVVVNRSHGASAFVTGVGVFDWVSGRVLAHSDPSRSYTDSLDGLERHDPRQPSYGVHSACWDLLMVQIEASPHPVTDLRLLPQHFYNLLHSWPTSHWSQLDPRHDSGRASQAWEAESWDIRQSYFSDEPRVPCFAPCQQYCRPTPSDNYVQGMGSASDVFQYISEEVTVLILNNLSSLDVCNLRLASRAVAFIAAPDRLPQSFWRSRFNRDKDLGFLSIQVSNYPADWYSLYHALRSEMKDNGPHSRFLRNARRVWKNIQPFTDYLVPLLEQGPRFQQSLSDLPLTGYNLGLIARCHLLKAEASFLPWESKVCRLVGTDYVMFHHPVITRALGMEIRVSFMTFDCTEHICGLRLLTHAGTDNERETSRVGLIKPSTETVLKIVTSGHLVELKVAIAATGIIGMGFCFDEDPGTVHSAGTIQNLPQGAGCTTLRAQAGRKIEGLAVGFDACKFFAIQLIERSCGHLLIPQQGIKYGLAPLFYPAELPCGASLPPTFINDTVKDEHPSLFMNMCFGGLDGANLSALTRIAAYHDDYNGRLKAFAFFYEDASSTVFGKTDIVEHTGRHRICTEQIIAIDGPGGERIMGVQCERMKSYMGGPEALGAVTMLTNWERYLRFECRRGSYDASLWLIMTWGYPDPGATGIIAKANV
ncbi:hypothetical protein B0I35DRAFT_441252 [Stachybotrys elegans]|uniref:DUF7600 domain-containing protein n=1 Tax=Stachybotrys elegans TaxID=80388 RepID=A0A8K0WN87_9HYPO|nr:hypothetical protein B0I35DRAFT_441252 [Stachybotrys elegans]